MAAASAHRRAGDAPTPTPRALVMALPCRRHFSNLKCRFRYHSGVVRPTGQETTTFGIRVCYQGHQGLLPGAHHVGAGDTGAIRRQRETRSSRQRPGLWFPWEGAGEAGRAGLGGAGLDHFGVLWGRRDVTGCLVPCLRASHKGQCPERVTWEALVVETPGGLQGALLASCLPPLETSQRWQGRPPSRQGPRPRRQKTENRTDRHSLGQLGMKGRNTGFGV